jgi:hypothetical protein
MANPETRSRLHKSALRIVNDKSHSIVASRIERRFHGVPIPVAARAYQLKGYATGGAVPEGPNESSPVRSAGLAFGKSDPSRTGRSTALYPRETAGERPSRTLSSLAGRTLSFASFPSTSYWATFIRSLRGRSSSPKPKSRVDSRTRPRSGAPTMMSLAETASPYQKMLGPCNRQLLIVNR